ncbi:LysE family transporter [Psychrobacillus sp. NEAU-3TGS]|uniref:LysE family transporter n=1 Tax=Psychrobacillus sp. NEAU-3TGS TaxID=2995412 RepID=UPI002497BAEF|nr:LysE family transporter [Psychrobacillus sp. NEAU-3TGS]MDI2585780.1 LysE family transporter [Psychrobacillus sp. NEAU-3TGS]
MPLFSLLLYAFVSSFTPGPNNIMAMLFANKYGFKKTFKFCLGVGVGFFVILILSAYFNLLLHNFLPKIEFIMKLLGAAYMLYLAIKIVTSKNAGNDNNGGSNNSFFVGVVLQFINPKAILYGITAMSTFVLPYNSSHFSLLFYSMILASIAIMSTSSWSMFGSIFKEFIAKYKNQFNIVMALLLVYSAITILIG